MHNSYYTKLPSLSSEIRYLENNKASKPQDVEDNKRILTKNSDFCLLIF